MLNKREAMAFLKQVQPMPDDANLDKITIEMYDKVRKYFLENMDEKCIPLFLNSFGNGSGYGVYQLIEDIIKKYPRELVLPHLIKALSSKQRGVRYWNVQISAMFPDKSLIKVLEGILQEDDPDMRYAAITSLQQIKDDRIEGLLKAALEKENDEEIIDFIVEILDELKS